VIRSTKKLIVVLVCLGFGLTGLVACSRQNNSDAQVTNPATSAQATASEQIAGGAPDDSTGPIVVPKVDASVDVSQYSDIPTGFTAEGYPYRGSPDAPVTLVEYSDYLCPFCKRHFDETLPGILNDFVRSGKLQYVFRDFPIASLHPTASQGHVAAWCVGEQDAAMYWKMHDLLFATRDQWFALPDPSAFLEQLAVQAGGDPAAYQTCIETQRTQSIVDAGVAAANDKGFNGTPSFEFVANASQETYPMIGAQSLILFRDWLDSMVAGKEPPLAEQAKGDEGKLPFWARSDGLRPNPLRPGTTMAGDPYRGNPDAKVVVVEYTDFQCPACAEFASSTQPTVTQKYIDSGQAMWVFKNLPLNTHPQAAAAATAGECAVDQGKFWEMHDLLFTTVDQWGVPDPDPELVRLAEELGLDSDSLRSAWAVARPWKACCRMCSTVWRSQRVPQPLSFWPMALVRLHGVLWASNGFLHSCSGP
jgi:protein-disulfide isomerase